MGGEYNKLWVALIGAIANIIEGYFGFSMGFLTEEVAQALIGLVTAFFVWFVPNKP